MAARPQPQSDDWLALTSDPLPVDRALAWATLPSCGGLVMFLGVVRDHAEGRPGVTALDYEAYEEHVVPRLAEVAAETRARWTTLGRIAMLHRVGRLAVGDTSVLVTVSAPHRDEAFAAARFGIDTLKTTVPIWKREIWQNGEDWAVPASPITETEASAGVAPAEVPDR